MRGTLSRRGQETIVDPKNPSRFVLVDPKNPSRFVLVDPTGLEAFPPDSF